MTKSSLVLNIPNKTLTSNKGSNLIFTFKKPRMESYPKRFLLFSIVKKMLKGFSLVFVKGTLWQINHLKS